MSVYKREGSPYYWTEFTIQGERVRRSTGCTTDREARAAEKRLKAEVKAEIDARGNAKRMTLDDAFGRYWVEQAPALSATWQRNVKMYAESILSILSGSICIDELSDEHVNEFVQERLAAGGGQYAINRALSVLRRVHNVAHTFWKQKIQVINWGSFKFDEEKRVESWTPAEIGRLVRAVPRPLGLAILWSFYTGCRKEATFGLTWDRVYFDRGYAEVITKGYKGKPKVQRIQLTAQVLDVLSQCDTSSRFVFVRTNMRKLFEAGMRESGLSGVWHKLRHSYATEMRKAGVPIEVVQRGLGHADIQTTMRYAHVYDDELHSAMLKLPAVEPISGDAKVVSLSQKRRS